MLADACATKTPPSCTDERLCEHNIDALLHSCDETDNDEAFIVTVVDSDEELQLYQTIPYCQQWKQKSCLYVKEMELIRRDYVHKKNLAYLFCL